MMRRLLPPASGVSSLALYSTTRQKVTQRKSHFMMNHILNKMWWSQAIVALARLSKAGSLESDTQRPYHRRCVHHFQDFPPWRGMLAH